MSKHEMVYEGKRKKGKVKTTRKAAPWNRKLRAVQRQAWNVLGGVGIIAVAMFLFSFLIGGR